MADLEDEPLWILITPRNIGASSCDRCAIRHYIHGLAWWQSNAEADGAGKPLSLCVRCMGKRNWHR